MVSMLCNTLDLAVVFVSRTCHLVGIEIWCIWYLWIYLSVFHFVSHALAAVSLHALSSVVPTPLHHLARPCRHFPTTRHTLPMSPNSFAFSHIYCCFFVPTCKFWTLWLPRQNKLFVPLFPVKKKKKTCAGALTHIQDFSYFWVYLLNWMFSTSGWVFDMCYVRYLCVTVRDSHSHLIYIFRFFDNFNPITFYWEWIHGAPNSLTILFVIIAV